MINTINSDFAVTETIHNLRQGVLLMILFFFFFGALAQTDEKREKMNYVS